MTTREAYVKRLRDELERWNAELVKLEAKAKEPLVGIKDAYEMQLKELREHRKAMHEMMTEIQKSGDQTWDRLRVGSDKAWKAMEESLKKARSIFK